MFSCFWLENPTPFRGSGPHSPPRWRTRGRRCDVFLHPVDELLSLGARLPSARRRRLSGTCLAGKPHLAREPTCPMLPDLVAHTYPALRHTEECVLAEPFNNSKKLERGQRILTPLSRKIPCFTLSTAASMHRNHPEQSLPFGKSSIGYPDCARYLPARGRHRSDRHPR